MGKKDAVQETIDSLAELEGHAELFAAQVRRWRRTVVKLGGPGESVDEDGDPRKMIVSARLTAFQAYCDISGSMGFLFGKDQPVIPPKEETNDQNSDRH